MPISTSALVKILAVTAAAVGLYAVLVMIADARDPYGTPDPEDDGDPAS